jgi:hypothetical protein
MLADDTREGSAMANKTRQRVSRHYLRNCAHFEVCNLRKTQNKSMNKKVIFFLSSLAAVAVAVPLAQADPRGGRGGGGHFGRAPARGGFAMTRGAGTFRQGGFNHWNGNRWSGDWRHRGHFRDRDRFIFFGDFGFPYYYGYPYYGSYPYDYYGYYPYEYSTPYGYDYGYYNEPAYGYDYSDRSRGGSSVVALQRQLARAGYYHGAIDGIMGPETRRAMRIYQRSRGALSAG